jgi:copper oxidase (laccase) domain-containing protein
MEPLRWNLRDDVRIAMSLAAHGDLRLAEARTAWCDRFAIPVPATLRQVHGRSIRSVDEAGSEGDGLAGDGEAVAVFGSDCPPLVIATGDALGAAHCGWRGTAAGIVQALVDKLALRSSLPGSTWQALVGPGVHPDDYEVDAAVLEAHAWPAASLRPGRPGRAWLDLPVAIASACSVAGVGLVARTRVCTSRHPHLRSHRRDGPGFPLMLVAWRHPCAG